jgi:hypothetical protein
MVKVLNIEYSNLTPTAPTYNAMAVFNKKDAEMAFKYSYIDFVFALNENTGTFARCNSVHECEKFYEKI